MPSENAPLAFFWCQNLQLRFRTAMHKNLRYIDKIYALPWSLLRIFPSTDPDSPVCKKCEFVSNLAIRNTIYWWSRDFESCDFENGASESKTVKLRMFTVIIDLLGVLNGKKLLNSFNKSLSLELSLKSILLKETFFLKSNFKNKSNFTIDQNHF